MLTKKKKIYTYVPLVLYDSPNAYLDCELDRNGIHPLTAFAMKRANPGKIRPQSPETQESVKSATPEPIDMESRKITTMQCEVRQGKEGEESPNLHVSKL